jgi:hypothetical protein
MRRFLPLILLGLWLLALVWPASRAVLGRDWNARVFSLRNIYNATEENSNQSVFGLSDDALRERFPDDLDVQVWLANAGTGSERESARALEPLVQKFPREKWLLAMWLQARVVTLRSNRNDGPMTNPNFPKRRLALRTPRRRKNGNSSSLMRGAEARSTPITAISIGSRSLGFWRYAATTRLCGF